MSDFRSNKDDWDSHLNNVDIEDIFELLKGKKLPLYDKFLEAVDKLSTQTDKLRDLCRSVSNTLKGMIPGAKIVYPAINPNSNCKTFVVLSTCPSDEESVYGYPVKTKNAYGRCNEDYSISNKEMNEDLCFKSKEDEENLNTAVNEAHENFSKWPNYSCISFSFYKSRKYNTNDHNTSLIDKGCIVLFVYLKHWKPVGWDFFTGYYKGYEIDVRESTCARKHIFALSSDGTFSVGGTMQGTLRKQGLSDKVFALTAAHCVFDDDTAERALVMKERDGLADLEDGNLPHVHKCMPHLQDGSVTKIVYGGSPFVDAALVKFDEKLHTNKFEFDWRKYGMIRQPSLRGCFQLGTFAQNDIVIKCGMKTGVTAGKVGLSDAPFDGEKGHIQIKSLKPIKTSSSEDEIHPFSDQGDSGSFVFVVNKTIFKKPPNGRSNHQKNDLALIGMVNGAQGSSFYATKMAATMAKLGGEYTFEEEEEEEQQQQEEEEEEEEEEIVKEEEDEEKEILRIMKTMKNEEELI